MCGNLNFVSIFIELVVNSVSYFRSGFISMAEPEHYFKIDTSARGRKCMKPFQGKPIKFDELFEE